MWKIGFGSAVVAGAAGLLIWDYTRQKTPFPLLTNTAVDSNSSFLVYNQSSSSPLVQKLKDLDYPVYCLSPSSESDFGLDDSSGAVQFVRKLGASLHSNSLEEPDKFDKWLSIHTTPYTEITSREALEDLLMNRNKFNFLDSIVVSYIPEDQPDLLEEFKSVIYNTQFLDTMNNVLLSFVTPHLKFIRITDPALAEHLGLIPAEGQKLVLLRIRDSRGWFHAKKPRSAYVDSHKLAEYLQSTVQKSFKINGHMLQLDLKLFCDPYYLGDTDEPLSSKFTDTKELSSHIARVDPLICPLWSIKDLQLIVPKLAYFLNSRDESKLIVISVDQDHEERDVSDLQPMFRALKLEEFARKNKDVLVVVGYPQLLYHLPVKDLAIYHYDNIEVRALWLNKQTVVRSALLEEGMELDDLLKSEKAYGESSPVKAEQHAEVLNIEKFDKKILGSEDRCYFVMNCSKHCPACSYQEPYFQLAAREAKNCQFAKYDIGNQSQYYKGPDATPKYFLYLPGSKTPIEYSARKQGINPENFLDFVSSHLN